MDTRGAKVSIVVPVYNRATVVTRTLDSIAAQTAAKDIQLILVDNASTDSTLQTLRQWSHSNAARFASLQIISEPKPGAACARNRGLAAATAPWVMFFDSDDTMQPTLVQSVIEASQSTPHADIIGWEIRQQLPDGRWHKGRFTTRRPLTNHLTHSILGTQRYAARRSLFQAAGAWDESLTAWDDYELGVRLLLRNPAITKIAGRPVTTYFTAQSLTGTSFSQRRGAWEKALDAIETALANARFKTTYADTRRAVLAAFYRREGERQASEKLLNIALSSHNPLTRCTLRLLYLKTRLTPRGTGIATRILFPRL